MIETRHWFLAAGAMSVAASLLHLACIAGGPSWYRFMGAGERMARAAERGDSMPALVTLAVALVLAAWAAYAFAAAGLLPPLPLQRTALVLISVVLLARALLYFAGDQWRPDLSHAFKLWSSVIVLVYGATFAIGTWRGWDALTAKEMS